MWLLAALVLVSGVGVVAAPSAVYSALFLTANLLGLGVIYLTLSSQFMAVAQLLIYAGAVMVVFLFAVTVLAPDDESPIEGTGLKMGAVLSGIALWVATASIMVLGKPMGAGGKPGGVTVEKFAQELFGKFLLPFEGTAFLLLVALMGAVMLGRRPGSGS